MYLLDTKICIYLIKKKSQELLRRLEALHPDEVGISSVTFAELQYGVKKSAAPERNARALLLFSAPLRVFAFDAEAAIAYGDVRSDLEKRGRPIGALDTMIAAHALALGAALVTNNVREFSRVAGLAVENWTRRST
jgi:tRNA(fMet)-specific endonuclease VapC